MKRKDDVTQELPVVPRRRGRPPTGQARTPAQRMRDFRQRMSDEGKEELPPMWVSSDVAEALRSYVARHNADTGEGNMTMGEAVDRIIKDRLLRKR